MFADDEDEEEDMVAGAPLKWQPQIGSPLLWTSPQEDPTVSYGMWWCVVH